MKLERGATKWRLIRDLAQGEHTQDQLATTYNCIQQTISAFASRHKEEILAHREKIDDAYAGLWVTQKPDRIAVHQESVEYVTELLESSEVASVDGKVQLLRARAAALRAVAEELGSLPTRVRLEGGGEPIRHVLEGVNTEDLA